MPTDSAPKTARARKRLGVSLAVPILLAVPAAWSLWSASETVPGNAAVSDTADPAPAPNSLGDAPALGRVVAPGIAGVERLPGLVSPPKVPVLEEPSPPDEPVPPPLPPPPAEPRPVISLPELEGDDPLVVVQDLIDASPLPALEESEGTVAPTSLVLPSLVPIGS
jgi:hypothetical protein